MRFLIDSNLLVHSCHPEDPLYTEALDALDILDKHSAVLLHITPQNLAEFWNVYTRPVEKNGLGHTIAEAKTEIKRFKRFYPLLEDVPAIYREWEKLITTYQVTGAKVYDTRLVAAMKVHQLTHILTFDDGDFKCYKEITVVEPAKVTSKRLFKEHFF